MEPAPHLRDLLVRSPTYLLCFFSGSHKRLDYIPANSHQPHQLEYRRYGETVKEPGNRRGPCGGVPKNLRGKLGEHDSVQADLSSAVHSERTHVRVQPCEDRKADETLLELWLAAKRVAREQGAADEEEGDHRVGYIRSTSP